MRGDIKAPFVAVLRADKRTQQPMVAVTKMGGGKGGDKRDSQWARIKAAAGATDQRDTFMRQQMKAYAEQLNSRLLLGSRY